MTKPPTLPEKEWFTLEEIAERWKTDRETLLYWSRCGLLNFFILLEQHKRYQPKPANSEGQGTYVLTSLKGTPVIRREERDRFEAEHRIGAHAGDLPKMGSDPRERTALLNIIGALMELIKSPRPGRDTNEAVIAELLDNWPEKYGISDRNLRAKFAEARRSLNEEG